MTKKNMMEVIKDKLKKQKLRNRVQFLTGNPELGRKLGVGNGWDGLLTTLIPWRPVPNTVGVKEDTG